MTDCTVIQACTPSDRTETGCYRDATGCEHPGTRRVVQDASCTVTLAEIKNLDGVAQAGATWIACSPTIRVTNLCEIVPPAVSPTPVTANGVDCAGAAVVATAVGVVQTVPHPTSVQLVKLCSSNISAPFNRSGTITLGGTAQVLMAANPSRKGYFVQDLSTGDLHINPVGTAAAGPGSIWLMSGDLYESPSGAAGTGVISIFGATTGQAFTAYELEN